MSATIHPLITPADVETIERAGDLAMRSRDEQLAIQLWAFALRLRVPLTHREAMQNGGSEK